MFASETRPSWISWKKRKSCIVRIIFHVMVNLCCWKLTACQRAQRTDPPCYVKALRFFVTSSCLSSSTCKQSTTINWQALCHWAPFVLWPAQLAQWQQWQRCQRGWNEKNWPLILCPVKSNWNNKLVTRGQLLHQEMFKKWNIMRKFRLVNIGVLMIHPCCSLTAPITLILSKSILLSALSLYIETTCLLFSGRRQCIILYLWTCLRLREPSDASV